MDGYIKVLLNFVFFELKNTNVVQEIHFIIDL